MHSHRGTLYSNEEGAHNTPSGDRPHQHDDGCAAGRQARAWEGPWGYLGPLLSGSRSGWGDRGVCTLWNFKLYLSFGCLSIHVFSST